MKNYNTLIKLALIKATLIGLFLGILIGIKSQQAKCRNERIEQEKLIQEVRELEKWSYSHDTISIDKLDSIQKDPFILNHYIIELIDINPDDSSFINEIKFQAE